MGYETCKNEKLEIETKLSTESRRADEMQDLFDKKSLELNEKNESMQELQTKYNDMQLLLDQYKATNNKMNEDNERLTKEYEDKYTALNEEYETCKNEKLEIETKLSTESRRAD